MMYDLVSVGVLSLDTILSVPFLPGSDSECFVRSIRFAHGGGAANVAAYFSFYGGLKAGLVSRVGSDEIGQHLVARMREYEVCTKGISTVADSLSTRILAVEHAEGHRSYFVYLGSLEELLAGEVSDGYVAECKLLYVAPCPAQMQSGFVETALRTKTLVALNPGTVYFQQESRSGFHQLLGSLDFLFVNEREARFYSNEDTTEGAGFGLRRLGPKFVIVTSARFGCHVFDARGVRSFRGHRVEPASSMGAGDAFAAGFLAEFLKTGDIDSAARMGNLFGAFGVSQPEIRKAAPRKDEFRTFLSRLSEMPPPGPASTSQSPGGDAELW